MMKWVERVLQVYPGANIWHNDDITIEGTTDVEDVHLSQGNATTNYGDEARMFISSYTGSSFRTVFRFDISGIDGGSSITNAQLYVYFESKYNTDEIEITSHACSQDAWVEAEYRDVYLKQERRSAKTDSSGRFFFGRILDSSYTLVVEAEGYGASVHNHVRPGDDVETFVDQVLATSVRHGADQ